MVQEPNPNTAIAKKFKQKLGNIKISSMRLFGSRAKGNFTKESDFDFPKGYRHTKEPQKSTPSGKKITQWNSYALQKLNWSKKAKTSGA